MKKAVLVVDHKNRDLEGIALIAHHLYAKQRIFPFITTTKNEISSLIKYRPDIILVQHVRHEHQREFLTYCKEKNIKIALSLAEGFPRRPEDIIFSIGNTEFVKLIDLILPWGKILANSCRQSPLTDSATISETGSPRFDYHSKELTNSTQAKENICHAFSMEKGRKIILWTTNFKYANYPEGDDALIRRIKEPSTGDHRISSSIQEKIHDHNLCFEKTAESVLRLAKSFPDITFLIKVHPAESVHCYFQHFSNYGNVVIFQHHENVTLSDLLSACDIKISYRCATSAETWLANLEHPSIEYQPDGLLLDDFDYLSLGNEQVSNYHDLHNLITRYLGGKTVPAELVAVRRQFIRDYLYSDDGKSAERCASRISDFLNSHSTDKTVTLKSSHIYWRHLKNYRFNRAWVALHRSSSHDKYISRKEVDRSMQRCSRAYNETAEYAFL
jgi:surface carbohydrate biosynthesis protein